MTNHHWPERLQRSLQTSLMVLSTVELAVKFSLLKKKFFVEFAVKFSLLNFTIKMLFNFIPNINSLFCFLENSHLASVTNRCGSGKVRGDMWAAYGRHGQHMYDVSSATNLAGLLIFGCRYTHFNVVSKSFHNFFPIVAILKTHI